MEETSKGHKKDVEGMRQGVAIEEEVGGREVVKNGGRRDMRGVMTGEREGGRKRRG